MSWLNDHWEALTPAAVHVADFIELLVDHPEGLEPVQERWAAIAADLARHPDPTVRAVIAATTDDDALRAQLATDADPFVREAAQAGKKEAQEALPDAFEMLAESDYADAERLAAIGWGDEDHSPPDPYEEDLPPETEPPDLYGDAGDIPEPG